MNYSKNIIQMRAKLNLSQEKLGEMIGVSYSTINRWENNKVEPSKKHIFMLIDICRKNNITCFWEENQLSDEGEVEL